MNEKKRQAVYAMIEYIDNYYRENRHTPSLREIEAEKQQRGLGTRNRACGLYHRVSKMP